MKIYQRYTFGRIAENNEIEYFAPVNGGLTYTAVRNGEEVVTTISNPNEAQMNKRGWYRVVNVSEEGTDYLSGNVIYHYVGEPDPEPDQEDVESENEE